MASKWDKNKILKEAKTRTTHRCSNCNSHIEKGNKYYAVGLDFPIPDPHLEANMRITKFCKKCYEEYGNTLLNENAMRIIKSRKSHKSFK